MSLKDLLSLATLKETVSTGGFILVVVASLLQVSKIPINPWNTIFGWIGERLNAKLNKRLDGMSKEFNELNEKFDKHVRESELKDIQDTRRDILEFANACMNGRRHTKEQFDFVIKECDDYELYIAKNDIKNGVVTSAIREIHRLYDKCIQNNSFLKEREDIAKEG